MPPAYSPIFNSTLTYSPGRIVSSGLGTSARTRTVEVVDSTTIVHERYLAGVGMGLLAADLELHFEPFLHEHGDDRQITRCRPEIDAHGVKLLDRHQRGRIAGRGRRTDQVAELDLQLADPAVDRGEHPAIVEIDLGRLRSAWPGRSWPGRRGC